MGGNVSVTDIKRWVENNIHSVSSTDLEQHLRQYNTQTIQITVKAGSTMTMKHARMQNLSQTKVLFALTERYLASLDLDTSALAKIDQVQDAKNFGVNYSGTRIDQTAINKLTYERYLKIKQSVRLDNNQSIIKTFEEDTKVYIDDLVAINENYVDSYQGLLIDEIAKIDSKLADELREQKRQKVEGIELSQVAIIAIAVAITVGAIALMKSKRLSGA